MEFKKVRDSAGTSRRHYKRVCPSCESIDWVLSTRLNARCRPCTVQENLTISKERRSEISKKRWVDEEYRKTHSEAMKNSPNVKRGEDHHFYKDGKGTPRGFTPEYCEWRTTVYERDDYSCQECGQKGGKLNAHHIVPWSVSEEKRFDLDNGQTLCYECHVKVHALDGGFEHANKQCQSER